MVTAHYLRFLNIFIPLYSVACRKPCSISGSASSIVLATLQIKSSFSVRNSACSRLMYIIVHSIFLCPSVYFTCMMSLVLWYSIVPFQCLRVWNVIFLILSLLIFVAKSFRCRSKVIRALSMSWLNM